MTNTTLTELNLGGDDKDKEKTKERKQRLVMK